MAVGLAGAGPGAQASSPRSGGGDYCCAKDQSVTGWFNDEFTLLHMEWGWPEGDPRELPACAVLGGQTVTESGRIDTSTRGGFETPFSPCLRGHGIHETQRDVRDPYYVQVRFLCNGRYPCGGAQYVLSRAVSISFTGLPPPPPPRCLVPRVTGLRLAAAGTRIRRGNCRVGHIRRARSRRIGRVIRQSPRPGAVRRQGYLVDLVVGRR